MKECLVFTNLGLIPLIMGFDSVLKSRDITLPTKVCIVKAMVSAVVMCVCETIKKGKHQKLVLSNCDAGEDS